MEGKKTEAARFPRLFLDIIGEEKAGKKTNIVMVNSYSSISESSNKIS